MNASAAERLSPAAFAGRVGGAEGVGIPVGVVVEVEVGGAVLDAPDVDAVASGCPASGLLEVQAVRSRAVARQVSSGAAGLLRLVTFVTSP
jgi:hypothetical protein